MVVSASHELMEMLVDPAINLMATGPGPKTVYAYESADPVEALSFPLSLLLRRLPQTRVFKNGKWSQIYGRGDPQSPHFFLSRTSSRGADQG